MDKKNSVISIILIFFDSFVHAEFSKKEQFPVGFEAFLNHEWHDLVSRS